MIDWHAWNLNWADFVVIGIVLVSCLISIARGFIKESISLMTWVVAIWIAMRFYLPLSDLLVNWINTPSARNITAFAVLFVVTLLMGSLLNFLVNGVVKRAGLSGFNRLVGVLFGFARGILVIGLLVLMSRHTSITNDPWWNESALLSHFSPIADGISYLMPQKVHQISRLLSDEKTKLTT